MTGRIHFTLDATGSRQPSWDFSSSISRSMFDAATGLNVRLVYFRGQDECKRTPYLTDPAKLKELMGRVECQPGMTQIRRTMLFAMKDRPDAVIYIGDQIEDEHVTLRRFAERMGRERIPMFVFHEKHDRRCQRATATFKAMAKASGGAYITFDASAPERLSGVLGSIAVFATGGRKALEARGSESDRFLLGHMS